MIIPDGYSVKIIDSRLDPILENELSYDEEQIVCIGISAMSGYQAVDGLHFSRICRQKFPYVPIVWGGWHPTIFPDQTIADSVVDIIVQGQGEITFKELVASLDQKLPLDSINGITYKKNGEIIANAERGMNDPNDFPALQYDLISSAQYLLEKKILIYISSVGCPRGCKYCCVPLMCKRRWFALKPERVLQEIEEAYERYGIKKIIFFDDIFFVDKKRVQYICEGLISKGIRIRWQSHARVDEICRFDERFIQLLKDSGLEQVHVGVESGSQAILDSIGKGFKVEDIPRAMKILQKNDIDFAANFMVGIPGEEKGDFEATVKVIQELMQIRESAKINIFHFTPFPGTEIFNSLVEKGLRLNLPQELQDWGNFFDQFKHYDKPWLLKNDELNRAKILFYLKVGYIIRPSSAIVPMREIARFFRYIAKIRLREKIYVFPVEWHLYRLLWGLRRSA